jgi:hypothetical protein
MNIWVRALLIGIGIWFIPFAVGMAIFAFVPPETALFDTLMSIVLAAVTTGGAFRFLSHNATPSAALGMQAGALWAAISLALDAPIFLFGLAQMRMPVNEYFADIGLGYLVIPIIAAGMGAAMARRQT